MMACKLASSRLKPVLRKHRGPTAHRGHL